MKKFLLDPNLSAQENLWRAAELAVTSVICSSKRRKKLRLNKEEWEDLVFRAKFETVCAFMRKLRGTGKATQGTYDRSKTFFLNIYSCAWSIGNHVIDDVINEIKIKLNSTSLDASSNPGLERAPKIVETLDESKCYLNYYRQTDKCKKLIPYRELTTQHLRDRRASEDYRAYVVECELLGVTPVDEFTWRGKNGYVRAFLRKPGMPTFKEMRRIREREAKRRERVRKQRKKVKDKTRNQARRV